jgi:DNA-binding NtrC family response regulator
LFLDEITETSLAMQSKLLRVLQEGEVRRIGETASRRVDVRIVVATNRDLDRRVAEGQFRQDLYYRLSVVRVDVPALRERVEDIPQLVAYFLQLAARTQDGSPALRVSSAAMRRLAAHPWPGNVRELENEVRRWLALVDDVVREDDLSSAILASTGGAPQRRDLPPGEALVELLSDPAFILDDEAEDAAAGGSKVPKAKDPAALEDAALDLRTHVDRVERALVGEALRRTGHNLTQAARLLGLSRFGLQKKLRRRDDAREPTLGGERLRRPPHEPSPHEPSPHERSAEEGQED